ncbi:glycosyltransferase family 4 protein [Cupriavidus necator]
MTLPDRTLRLARYFYHRVPLPQAVKWRLREKFSPLLLALRKAQLDGNFLRHLKQLLEAPAGACDQDAMNQIALRLFADLASHCRAYGPLTHIFALPFLGKGGAELTAIQFARAIGELRPGCSVGIFVTDRNQVEESLMLPSHVKVINLWDYLPDGLSEESRMSFLHDCLMAAKPHVFHVINSDLGWRLICRDGLRMKKVMRLYGSIFALQFTPDFQNRIGYAEYYLREGIDVLDGLFSDNLRFQNDAIEIYDLADARHKFIPVYNACRIAVGDWEARAQRRVGSMSAGGQPVPDLIVLWAGRLDEEKRVDLLFETAARCPEFHFHVYGQSVVGTQKAMPELANIHYHGPFRDPEQAFDRAAYDVFMFTSRWEGLPNMLLEVGALGIPVIAPDVGGIRELIDESTGFLVPQRATPQDYVQALQSVHANRPSACKRALALLNRIRERHTWPAFCRRLDEIPDYL